MTAFTADSLGKNIGRELRLMKYGHKITDWKISITHIHIPGLSLNFECGGGGSGYLEIMLIQICNQKFTLLEVGN